MSSETALPVSSALPVSLSTVAATPAKAAVTRRGGSRHDALRQLATLIAEALADKVVAAGGGADVLTRLLGGRPRCKRGLSIAKLIDSFLDHCKTYYRYPDGTPTPETEGCLRGLRLLRKAYGRSSANEFRPLKLKAVREQMVAKGWCRKSVNQQVSRIKRMFKWAVGNELIAADRYHALQAVPGLKIGRTAAREMPPVKPVAMELVEATLPHLPRQVAAMVRLQALTGMRPGEVCIARTCDIDRTRDVWLYRPSRHKTAHHAHERLVYFGPKAQEVVTPFLKEADPEAYLFSAAERDAERRARQHAARKTPLSCGNVPGSNCKRRPRKQPGPRYRRDSYTRAIAKGCRAAFPIPDGLDAEATAAWRREHHWHPHQLRHNAATLLRREFGIDAAQVILGHKTLSITEVYAEKNTAEALRVMRAVG